MGPIHGIITWEKKPPLGHIIIIHNIIFVIKFATIIKYTILSLCLLLHATNILYDAFLPLNTYSADTCTSILIFGILWWICRCHVTHKGVNSRKLQTRWRCVFRIEFDIETGPWPPYPPQCRRVAPRELVHILTFRRWPRENRIHNIIRRGSQFRNAEQCLYNISFSPTFWRYLCWSNRALHY